MIFLHICVYEIFINEVDFLQHGKMSVVVCLPVRESSSDTEADADVVAQSCSDVHRGVAVCQL